MTGGRTGFIDFERLRNPVLQYADWSIKDCACCYHEESEAFYLFFSAFYEDEGMIRSHVVEVETKDFRTFSDPILHLDGKDQGWLGMCSPDLLRHGDTYYLTFNSWGDLAGKPNQLFYKTSKDLVHWSEGYAPLAPSLTNGNRAIDASMIYENNAFYLFWKERTDADRTRLARAPSLSDDFEFVGNGYPTFVMMDGKDNGLIHENFCFFKTGDGWRVVMTDYMKDSFEHHNSYIYTLLAAGEEPERFLAWGEGCKLDIERQRFNTDHRANAAALYDWRKYDGYFYLLYAGNAENTTFATRGHNRLGISRSTDLVNWIPLSEGM
ncbi:hypothetical protein MO973_10900 [Paenibacillus sp. TRM 82003]|nr:hypothetical protein [Paenibacillus sp. TRM 82003]